MAIKRFSLRKNGDWTWSIVNIFTDLPVVVDDQVMTEMDEEEAGELVELLNSIDRQRRHIFARL